VDVPTAPLLDAREHDSQFPVHDRRGCPAGIECAVETDRAREPAEASFGQMKRGLLMGTGRGQFASHDDQGALREKNPQVSTRHTGKIHQDLDPFGRFEHVHRRRAFPRRHGVIVFDELSNLRVIVSTTTLRIRLASLTIDMRHSRRIVARGSRGDRAAPEAAGSETCPMSQIPQEFREAVSAIGADRQSGATTLVLRGLEVLRRAAGERRNLRRVAVGLCRAQPSMAGFRTAAALALSANDPLRTLDELAARIERAPSAIARIAAPLIRLRTSTGTLRVVTCSRSALVERTLLELARTEPLDVACAESRPAREGVRLAEELTRQGLQVQLYSDAAVGGAVRGADALVVGADAVTSNWFINKVGTAGLAALATLYRVPVFVLAGREKILPDRVFRSLPLSGGPAVELEESQAYRVMNPYFERIESFSGDHVLITEAAAVPFHEVDAASLWYNVSVRR